MKTGLLIKIVLALGLALMALAVLFPRHVEQAPGGEQVSAAGRRFVFSAKKSISLESLAEFRPDFSQVGSDLIVIGMITAVGLLLVGAGVLMARGKTA